MTFVAGLLPQSVMPADVKFVRNILSVMVSADLRCRQGKPSNTSHRVPQVVHQLPRVNISSPEIEFKEDENSLGSSEALGCAT